MCKFTTHKSNPFSELPVFKHQNQKFDIVENINDDFNEIFSFQELRLFILLYADDAVLFAKSPKVLQSLLHDLEIYCLTWGLKINTSKTKAMIFEKGRHTYYDFYLNNVKLELVTSFKYLGIHFFKNGHWYRTQKRLAKHASFALHNLFSVFREIELPVSEKCKLFDSLAGSILNYGAEVWGCMRQKMLKCCIPNFVDGFFRLKNQQTCPDCTEN